MSGYNSSTVTGILRNFIFLAGLLCATAGWTQRFYIDSFDASIGLKGSVNDIAADSLGFIWLATDEGLYRFDNPSPTLIRKERHSVLFPTHNGELLAGTADEISTLCYSKLKPEFYEFLKSGKGDHYMESNHIAQEVDGEFWWVLPDGIIRFNDTRSKKYELDRLEGSYTDLQVLTYKNQVLLTSKHGEIYYFDKQKDEFVKPKNAPVFNEINASLLVGERALLIQIPEDLYLIRTDSAGNIESADVVEGAPEGINVMAVTSEGNVFAGTESDGLYFGLYQNNTFIFTKIFNGNDPHRIEKLPFTKVNSIYIQSPREIWIGHDSGATLLRELTFTNVDPALPHANVTGFAQLENGQSYAGIDGVLYEITGRKHPYVVENVELNLGVHRPSVLHAVGNRLWITTTRNKIFYLENGKKSRVLDMSHRGTSLFAVNSDKEGNVWVAQAPSHRPIVGILKITPDFEVIDYNEDSGFESRMLIAKQAPSGDIYAAGIGEKSYLYRYDPILERFVNISAPMEFNYGDNFEVHDIAIGKDSTVWLGSTAGLLRYKNGQIEKIRMSEFHGKEAFAVLTTDDGATWFSSDSKGLIRYKDGKTVIYNQELALPTNLMVYRTLFLDKYGKMWVGTREGVSISIKPNPQPTPTKQPRFLNVKVDDQPISIGKENIKLEAGSTLQASFVSLTYPLNKQRYKYRVHGLDSSWSSSQEENVLVLKDLPTGEYQLEIKAKQVAGYIESNPLRLSFTVGKVWYATWWALALFVTGTFFGLAGVFYTGYTVRVRAIHRQQVALKKLVDERTRELQESNNQLEHQKMELRKSAESLKQKNNELDQFAYIVSHDLKAPLRAINHLSQWIEEDLADKTTGDIQKNMDLLRGRVYRMENLIDGILGYARVGNIEIKLEDIDLNLIVQEVIQMLDIPDHFNVKIETALPVVCANSTLMEQIFSNLISNAIKYHDKPQGNITIGYKDDNEFHILSVTDDGPGIPKEFHEKAFAIFQTLLPKDSRESTGVGLAIVKKIVKEHGGRIWIESERGKGTTFLFTLPKCRKSKSENDADLNKQN